jgi:hypothetical protein
MLLRKDRNAAPIILDARIFIFSSDSAPMGLIQREETSKMNIAEHIKDPHAIAAFNDMAMRGAAEFVLRDDGALLMIIRNKTTEEVLFRVTQTGLRCLARLNISGEDPRDARTT